MQQENIKKKVLKELRTVCLNEKEREEEREFIYVLFWQLTYHSEKKKRRIYVDA